MLLLDHESITKGGVHFTPNPLYTLPGIIRKKDFRNDPINYCHHCVNTLPCDPRIKKQNFCSEKECQQVRVGGKETRRYMRIMKQIEKGI
jgi:hypothetical protein